MRMASALSLVTPQGEVSELQLKMALFCVTTGRVPIDEVCTLMPLFLELFFQVRSWIEVVAPGALNDDEDPYEVCSFDDF